MPFPFQIFFFISLSLASTRRHHEHLNDAFFFFFFFISLSIACETMMTKPLDAIPLDISRLWYIILTFFEDKHTQAKAHPTDHGTSALNKSLKNDATTTLLLNFFLPLGPFEWWKRPSERHVEYIYIKRILLIFFKILTAVYYDISKLGGPEERHSKLSAVAQQQKSHESVPTSFYYHFPFVSDVWSQKHRGS